jgi:hypothetical protein
MKDYVNEMQVSIKIHDFECDASQISDILGVQSTHIWKKGEPRGPGATILHESNCWMHKITKYDVIYVGEMIDELVGIFEDKVENFKQLPKECYIEIAIIGFFKRGMPSIAFNKRAIDFIHKIGADIDFDLY